MLCFSTLPGRKLLVEIVQLNEIYNKVTSYRMSLLRASDRYPMHVFQHGEPGAAVADFQPVDIVVSHVLKQILSTVCL